MKIYPIEETIKHITQVNPWLYSFEAHGAGNFMVKDSAIPLRADWVKQAFEEITYPLEWMQGFEIFLLPYTLTTVDENMVPAGFYEGQAFPTHFVIGARRSNTYDSAAVVAIHETGHILTYKFIDPDYADKVNTEKMKEYMRLRGLDPNVFGYGFDWNLRVWEVLAEDFRYLFGSPAAHSEPFIHDMKYVGLQPPSDKIRQWFLDVVPEHLKDDPLEIEIVGGALEDMKQTITMDVPAEIKNGRFYVVGRPFVEALGGKAVWNPNEPNKGIFELNRKRITLENGSYTMIIEDL